MMDKVFFEIECLTEHSPALDALRLANKWFPIKDKRFYQKIIQKFVELNRENFNFLGITPIIEGFYPNIKIYFRSSQYIGVVPVVSPTTGKPIADFIVYPRFLNGSGFDDYIKIITLLEQDLNAEFINSWPLLSGKIFQPPLYYEAVKFIRLLASFAKQKKWVKFSEREQTLNVPQGNVNWNKYLKSEFKVENKTKFPVRKNVLSENHSEFGQIKFVYDLSKKEIFQAQTPNEIKLSVKEHIRFLDHKLELQKPVFTKIIQIKSSDFPAVKELKSQANKILQNKSSSGVAWRIDFNQVFEKYVQFIFSWVARELGGQIFPNSKIKSLNKKYEWELNYLEPDIVFRKGKLTVFIDAKYKSHLFNKFSDTKTLKEEFRKDLHQILAYTAFSAQRPSFAMLVYPSAKIEDKQIELYYPLTNVKITVVLVGMPLDTKILHQIAQRIKFIIENLNLNHFSD